MAVTSPPLVQMRGGTVSKSGRLILEDANVRIGRGEVCCLLGPNGAGKSTLLRCLAGLESLDRGSVRLAEDDVTTLKPREIARRVSFLFQDDQFVFPYRVLDVVVAGRSPYLSPFAAPGAADYRRAAEALEKVEAIGLAERTLTELSGGERQLVLIARALVQETPLLLLDEPTAHLDLRNEILVLETVNLLAKRYGIGILMASHAPNQAFVIDSRVVLMRDGRIRYEGSPDKVLTPAALGDVFDTEVAVVSTAAAGTFPPSFIIPAIRPPAAGGDSGPGREFQAPSVNGGPQ